MTNASASGIRPLKNVANMPDRVTEALQGLIRSGEFLPKSRLPAETEMAARFGVSRTVIREAVSRLKSEGLVQSRQGSGVFVRESNLDAPFRINPIVADSALAALQILELRRGLESEIAALAAERRSKKQATEIKEKLRAIDADVAAGNDGVDADMEFHRSIARAAGNPHFLALWDFVSQFLKKTMAITRSLEARKEPLALQVLQEHELLMDSIVRKDIEGARAAARNHMEMAAIRIKNANPTLLKAGNGAHPVAPVKKSSRGKLKSKQ